MNSVNDNYIYGNKLRRVVCDIDKVEDKQKERRDIALATLEFVARGGRIKRIKRQVHVPSNIVGEAYNPYSSIEELELNFN